MVHTCSSNTILSEDFLCTPQTGLLVEDLPGLSHLKNPENESGEERSIGQ